MAENEREEPRTITVSRDALRADLLGLELRLKDWMSAELALKANAAVVDKMFSDIGKIKEGEFTHAQRMAMVQIYTEQAAKADKSGWSRRERWMAFVSLGLSLVAVIFSIIYTVHVVSAASGHS